jgi:hypothetical protein
MLYAARKELQMLTMIWNGVVAVVKAAGEFFGWRQQADANAHDDGERQAGSDAQARATQDAAIGSLERQNQAAVDGPKSGDDAAARLKEGKF